jgi:hypothetical protein
MEGVVGGDKATSQTIQTEACEVLTAGFELFYPSPLKKAQFVLDLLNVEESSDKVIDNTSSTNRLPINAQLTLNQRSINAQSTLN